MNSVLRAAIVVLSVMPEMEWALGQRAPCYKCEVYKDLHPQSKPYEEIRSHCSYPCECPERAPTCAPGMSVVRDGCGCCNICARQPGEPCDGTQLCDEKRGLVCQFPSEGAAKGFCQVVRGLPCTVYNRTYDNGETFLLDCRTQCSCQNGTYACASLCPSETISPQGACLHPRLVEVPGQCCREWMCDSTAAQYPPVCQQVSSPWSACSAACGLGLSHRVSNLNSRCVAANETRLCQLRPCDEASLPLASPDHDRHHHVRKGHECKATQRTSGPVHLRFGPCRSRKRYRPKFCGHCGPIGLTCLPQLSTTIRVEFRCDGRDVATEDARDLLLDLAEPGTDLWWPDADNKEENEEDHKHHQQQLQLQRQLLQKVQPFWSVQNTDYQPDKVFVSLQLILRCQCSAEGAAAGAAGDTLMGMGTASPTAAATTKDGEAILHRVHRTTVS